MRIRRRFLPSGWYPDTPERTREMIGRLSRGLPAPAAPGIAGIVPHAGWEFSGRLALEVFSCLSRSIDTIVIIGGHLGPADGIVSAAEDAYETPLGPVTADLELLEALRGALDIREDRAADNTVEVQLPFVRHLFPTVRVLGMRAAPSEEARRLGEELARVERGLNRRFGVIGSTDLTHYGTSYGFQPAGEGERAVEWVKDKNDRRFIEALLALDFDAALQRALKERSACSAGGALAAMTFARDKGITAGSLLGYSTSYDVHPAESFVGYAGILYQS
jgi:hypothetical protein